MDTKQFPAVPAAEPAADRTARRRLRLPARGRRPAILLATAAAGAIVVNTVIGAQPAAEAEAETETVTASMSVAEQLGITAEATQQPLSAPAPTELAPLEDLAASRSERQAAEAQAAQVQAAAEQAELDRQAAEKAAAEKAAAEQAAREAAEREAAEKAAAEAAARAAAERQAASSAAAPAPAASSSSSSAPRGSFKDYAMSKVGSAEQFSCLEKLWGKESGWNPNAQNPTSTAYGIPQFLNSTWASTGIAKTSDGYRQIDAGLIYIENRYGSPCGAWSHSQAKGWY
ncbi:aggregation-promoting factor C-terminal-like domain-containing protein [Geodermatophilus sp. URMC 60]